MCDLRCVRGDVCDLHLVLGSSDECKDHIASSVVFSMVKSTLPALHASSTQLGD